MSVGVGVGQKLPGRAPHSFDWGFCFSCARCCGSACPEYQAGIRGMAEGGGGVSLSGKHLSGGWGWVLWVCGPHHVSVV